MLTLPLRAETKQIQHPTPHKHEVDVVQSMKMMWTRKLTRWLRSMRNVDVMECMDREPRMTGVDNARETMCAYGFSLSSSQSSFA